ncbi:hypothetical protein [Marispirochaeta sp.]|uniref:hypothetical protein n=1 Tax=Marispirochaeta sp. TaxID=2038653 RepID=UPI0029C64686|nr:hypothetical protein [Marispirochaeta sp.]
MKKMLLVFVFLSIAICSLSAQASLDEQGKNGDAAAAFDDLFSDIETEGDAAGGEPAAVPLSADSKLSLDGEHRVRYSFPLHPDHFDYERKVPTAGNVIKFRYLKESVTVLSEWDLLLEAEQGRDLETRSRVLPGENYISWALDRTTLTLGYQRYAWGVGDDINPTDNIDYKNYRDDPFSPDDLPVFSGHIQFYPTDEWELALVVVPVDGTNREYFSVEEEIPGEIFAGNKSIEREEPVFSPESTVWGFKINHYGAGLDWSASYVYDFDSYYTPRLELKDNGGIWTVETLGLRRDRIHRIGVDAKKVVGRYSIWTEAAYSISKDFLNDDVNQRNHDLAWVVGGDFQFGGLDQHYCNFQYYGLWIPDFYDNFSNDYPGGIPDPGRMNEFDYMRDYYYRSITESLGGREAGIVHGLALSLEGSFHRDKIKPTLDLAVEIPDRYDDIAGSPLLSAYLDPSIVFDLAENFDLEVRAPIAFGLIERDGDLENNDESEAGILSHDNSISLTLRYRWKKRF